MLCKTCNTRFHDTAVTCPNCGWHPPGRRPRASDETAPTALSPLAAEDESVAEDPNAATAPVPKPEPRVAAPEPAATPAAAAPPPEAAPPAATPAPAMVAPDPQALRLLLAEQPDLIEAGLEILRDDAGKPVGASYATGVGDIDLLARDEAGGLVVVLVSETSTGDALVAEALRRVGWVRKHLGSGGERVRGIVLVAGLPDDLSYAAAAVTDTVSFKTWRVALTFSDLEI